jgi:hypothetical protein
MLILAIPIEFAIMIGLLIYSDVVDNKEYRKREETRKAIQDTKEDEEENVFDYLDFMTDEQLETTKKGLRTVDVSHDGFADNIRDIYIAKIDAILALRAIQRMKQQVLKLV